MANVKISALSAAAALTGVETLPVVQSASTVKATVSQIATLVQSQTITSASTAITVVGATHNNNVLATTATSPVTVTLNTGVALPSGMVIVQRGNGGIVSIAGTATRIAPNGVSTSGVDTFITIVPTGVTDEYEIVVGSTADKTLVNATAGATPAVDMSKYNVVDLTLTANCTPTFSGAVAGQMFSVTLIIRQDATGSRTLTLPTTKWAGGSAYVTTGTASSIDIITLSTLDGGSTYFGFVGGKAFA